jgi:hypothetical protein
MESFTFGSRTTRFEAYGGVKAHFRRTGAMIRGAVSSDPKPNDKRPAAAAPTRTVVGVPSLDPSKPVVGQVPPAPPSAPETSTAVDMASLSKDEADRILAWTGFTNEEVPTALGVAPQGAASKSPTPSSVATVPTLGAPKQRMMATQGGLGPMSIEPRGTTHGLAPSGSTHFASGRPPAPPPRRPSSRPPPLPGRRATLVMDAGAPSDEPPSITDRPPIVVPAASGRAPKAVTQPPPWGNERVELGGIPRAGGLPRAPEESIEEVSASVFLPEGDEEDLIATRHKATGAMVEEISGSMLLPDDSKPPTNARSAARPLPPPPGASRPAPAASRPPPPPIGSRAPPPLAPPPARSVPPPPPAPVQAAPPPAPPPPQQAWGNDDVPLPADVPIPPPPDIISHPAWPPAISAVPTPPPPTARVEPSVPLQHVPTLPLPELKRDLPGAAPMPLSGMAEKISDKITEKVLHYLPPSNPLHARPTIIVPVVLGAGGLLAFLLLALVVSAFTGGPDKPTTTAIAGVAWRFVAAAPTAENGASSSAQLAPTQPVVASTTPCAVTGTSHVVSPRADMHVGVEARAAGDGVALAFAPSKKDALAVSLDPATLASSGSSHTRTAGSIRRLTPIVAAGGAVTAVVDTDRKGDRIGGRRYIAGDSPVDVGVTDSSIVASAHGSHDTSSLWAMEDSSPLDALRGVSFTLHGKHAYAIAFRRAGAVYAGVFTGDKMFANDGALARFDGLGTKVGSPTVAVSNETVLVAWADRSSNDDPWSIRVAHFHAGDAAPGAQTFVAPSGGLGTNIMSPRASALPGGRFLFVWVEGPLAGTQVRAATLGGSATLLGAPMTVSADGVNSGAGDSAVTPDGRGIVGFLSASGAKKFEVDAVPLSCPL